MKDEVVEACKEVLEILDNKLKTHEDRIIVCEVIKHALIQSSWEEVKR